MPKLNVYVTDDLAAQIKQAGISLSPVCQRALEKELRRTSALQTLGSDGRLAAAKERIAASGQHEAAELYEKGNKEGHEWAIQRATYPELRTFQRWYQSTDWPFATMPTINDQEFPTAFYWIEAADQSDWMIGFVEGSLQAWDAIEGSGED